MSENREVRRHGAEEERQQHPPAAGREAARADQVQLSSELQTTESAGDQVTLQKVCRVPALAIPLLREDEVRGRQDHPPQQGDEDDGLLRLASQPAQDGQAVVPPHQPPVGGLPGGDWAPPPRPLPPPPRGHAQAGPARPHGGQQAAEVRP